MAIERLPQSTQAIYSDLLDLAIRAEAERVRRQIPARVRSSPRRSPRSATGISRRAPAAPVDNGTSERSPPSLLDWIHQVDASREELRPDDAQRAQLVDMAVAGGADRETECRRARTEAPVRAGRLPAGRCSLGHSRLSCLRFDARRATACARRTDARHRRRLRRRGRDRHRGRRAPRHGDGDPRRRTRLPRGPRARLAPACDLVQSPGSRAAHRLSDPRAQAHADPAGGDPRAGSPRDAAALSRVPARRFGPRGPDGVLGNPGASSGPLALRPAQALARVAATSFPSESRQ